MWGLASAQEETSWSESPSAKLTEVAKGSREAHAHSNPHAWQLLFGIARNGNQTMKRAKECFWSRVWWDVLLEHLCYVFCRYIVLIHDAWTSLNHGHISEKNQSSIKHTDRQAVNMDSCQDVTNNKKTYHTSAHSIDHRVKHSQLAIGNCSASHNVADYQCILGVQHFYYLQSKSLILTSCKHHPKPHQQTRACFSHVWLWVVCVFHFIFKMIYLSLSWGEILQHLAFWEVQKGNRCHSEWRDVFAGLPPYVEDHTAALLQLIQPCEALYRIAVFTLPNATVGDTPTATVGNGHEPLKVKMLKRSPSTLVTSLAKVDAEPHT